MRLYLNEAKNKYNTLKLYGKELYFNPQDLNSNWEQDENGDWYTNDFEEFVWIAKYFKALEYIEDQENAIDKKINQKHLNEYDDYIWLYESKLDYEKNKVDEYMEDMRSTVSNNRDDKFLRLTKSEAYKLAKNVIYNEGWLYTAYEKLEFIVDIINDYGQENIHDSDVIVDYLFEVINSNTMVYYSDSDDFLLELV